MKKVAVVLFVLTAWGHAVSSHAQVWTNAPPPVTPSGWTNNNAPPPPWYATVVHTGVVAGVYSNLQFSGRGTQELTRIINAIAGTATNGINAVVNTTNPAGVASLATNTLFIGTNSVALDTNTVIALINASTNTAARLASNIWAAADSTTNYVRRTGGNYTGTGSWSFVAGGSNNPVTIQGSDGLSVLGKGGDVNVTAGNGDTFGGSVFISAGSGDSGAGDVVIMRGDTAILSTTGTLVNAVFGFSGSGAGITDLNSGALTNLGSGLALSGGKLTATNVWFSSTSTQGSGNVVTNLTFGGSVITQQMGTVTGGGGAEAISNAFVHFNLGAARNATNNQMGLVRGYLDTDTATNDIFPAFFITVSSNVVQDAYAKAWVRWPVSNPTQIQLRVWYQGTTNNPLEARFSNGTNAVAYILGASSADAENTINLSPSGFLTNVAENAAVQLRVSAAFASTSTVPMGRGIIEGVWVRR